MVPEYIMIDLVLSPEFKKPPGRPRKKSREKSAIEMFEFKGTNTCSTCGIAGHNRRSCRISLGKLRKKIQFEMCMVILYI